MKEAGGIVTDMQGNALDRLELELKQTTSLLAAGNAGLDDLALTARLGSPRHI